VGSGDEPSQIGDVKVVTCNRLKLDGLAVFTWNSTDGNLMRETRVVSPQEFADEQPLLVGPFIAKTRRVVNYGLRDTEDPL
jgi:hypothetical protein